MEKTVHLSFEQALELQMLLCREIRGVSNGISLCQGDMNDDSLGAEIQELTKELMDSHIERREKLKGILDLVAVSPYGPETEKE